MKQSPFSYTFKELSNDTKYIAVWSIRRFCSPKTWCISSPRKSRGQVASENLYLLAMLIFTRHRRATARNVKPCNKMWKHCRKKCRSFQNVLVLHSRTSISWLSDQHHILRYQRAEKRYGYCSFDYTLAPLTFQYNDSSINTRLVEIYYIACHSFLYNH